LKPMETSIRRFLWKKAPIYKHIGLTVESAGNGVYSCRIPLNVQNGNHIGTIHACIQWAAAEMLGGLSIVGRYEG
jgi:acyl-coenzyme A thioesterase PaaI-like protein